MSAQARRELTKQFSDHGQFEEAEAHHLLESDAEFVQRSSTHTILSRFMPTSRRIVQFSDGVPAPPNARIIYIDGAFDMFHPGHIDILKVRVPRHTGVESSSKCSLDHFLAFSCAACKTAG